MIRFHDSIVLAHTKLRTHKVRTGITIGVAGILFGLIFSGVFVAQGVFDSVERFNSEGLADRSIVAISKYGGDYFSAFNNDENGDFIAEVKQAHADKVALKSAAAKKYSIDYDPKTEDPFPIETDTDTGKERISDVALRSDLVQTLAEQRDTMNYEPLDIDAFLSPYDSAKVLEGNAHVQPKNGTLLPMEDGKEKILTDRQDEIRYRFGGEDIPVVRVLNASVAAPFITDKSGVQAGELPGVVSFGYAEKLLGLEPLTKDSTNDQKLARLQEVRQRISEVTAAFCYRNEASQQLLAQATRQRDDIERNKANKDYKKPSLMYALPSEESCGAVTVVEDTRTEAEKKAAANIVAYQKEIGEYIGEPEQQKVILRAIGLSGDGLGTGMSTNVGDMVVAMLGSWLYYTPNWSIPADLLAEASPELRPEALFGEHSLAAGGGKNNIFRSDEYMVEFADKDEARAALDRSSTGPSGIMVMPYGSGVLFIDQLKQWFAIGVRYALALVGGVALIILASLIGRMVSDGRRESAVFRAIGAKRIDIGSIYGMYAFLLSLRVALFALVVGLVVSLAVDLWLSADATVGARLAYAAVDTSKSFHFIGFGSWYIPAMVGIIVMTGLLASTIPIFLGSRRNPIKDMRDDT